MKKITLAGCLIFDSKGKLLLLHRNTPKRIQWEIPGGKVEENETPEEAAAREILEELGVGVTIQKLVGTMEFEEDGFYMDYSWFLTIVTNGVPKIIETDKFDKLDFHNWSDLAQIRNELSANTKNLLQQHEQGLLEI
jgi:mutator protein MutT